MLKRSLHTLAQYRFLIIGLFLAVAVRTIWIGDVAYPTDLYAYFKPWSMHAYKNGLINYYQAASYEYPPGYIPVLWCLGGLTTILKQFVVGLTEDQLFAILFKIPVLIFDLAGAVYTYLLVQKLTRKPNLGLIASLVYLFNPTFLYNTMIWPQLDGVLCLGIVASAYYLILRRFDRALFASCIIASIKPQGLFILVLIGLTCLFQLIGEFVERKNMKLLVSRFGSQIFFPIVLVFSYNLLILLPINGGNFVEVFGVMKRILGLYPYASVNGANFWLLLGGNWQSDLEFKLMQVSSGLFSLVLVAVLLVGGAFAIVQARLKHQIILVLALCLELAGYFATRQHERYLEYPIALLIVWFFIHRSYPSFMALILYITGAFLNQAVVAAYPKWIPSLAGVDMPLAAVCLGAGIVFTMLDFFPWHRCARKILNNHPKAELVS